MSDRERAAEVITTWQARHKTEMDNNTTWAAQNLAGDLADAGLLAPDAPEPGVFKDGSEVEWDTLDGYVNVENGLIIVAHDERVEGDPPEKDAQLWPEPGQLKFLNPAAAEEIGELLIAAAKYAAADEAEVGRE